MLLIVTLIQSLLLVLQAEFRLLPLGGNDWRGYNGHAVDILHSPNGFFSALITSDENLFSKVLASTYYILGEYLQFGYFMVFITALLAVNAIIRIANELGLGDRYAHLLVALFACWPINFVFSVTLLREMPIQACVAWATYFLILSVKRRRWRYLVGSGMFALIATLLHSALIVYLAAILLFVAVFDIRGREWRLGIGRTGFAAGIAVAFAASPIYSAAMAKFGEGDLDTVIERAGYAAGETAYVTAGPSNVADIIVGSPTRLVMFLTSPMPWQARGLNDIIGVLASSLPTVVVIGFLVFLVGQVRSLPPDERAVFVVTLVIASMTALVLAWGTANYGTAMRHRVKILPALLVPLVIAMQHVYKEGKKYVVRRDRFSE